MKGDQIIKALLDFKLEPVASRDFVRTLKLIFQRILPILCQDWQRVEPASANNAPQGIERSHKRCPTRRVQVLRATRQLAYLDGGARALHPIMLACVGYHTWALAGLGQQGDRIEAAVTAARIAAPITFGEGQGAVFAPLVNLAADPFESEDLAEFHPEKLAEMIEAWEQYARDVGVFLPEGQQPDQADQPVGRQP